MTITNLKGNGQIRTGRTELDVPHQGKTLVYVLPLVGPSNYKDLMNQIDSQKLHRPTTAETLSLIDLALQNQDEPHCTEILRRFKKNYLWTSTESMSFPEGVLVYENINGNMPENSKGLIDMLNAKDGRVRLVKPGFNTGAMSISDFLKHPYVIAQIGENMIPTAERVAKAFHKEKAHVFGLDKSNSDVKRYSALNSGWDNGRLYLYGSCADCNNGGCASGVSP